MPVKPQYTSVWARDAARAAEENRAADASSPNRAQIVRAALEILDGEGLDALSMRRLGTRLGMGATSLYWYVANKNELLDLVIDEFYGEIEMPGDGPWEVAAGVLAHSMRQALLRHPWAAHLVNTRTSLGPRAMALTERVLITFQNAGFPGRDADFAVSTLIAYVLGVTSAEVGWREMVASAGMSPEEWMERQKSLFDAALETRPRLRTLVDHHHFDADHRTTQAVRFDFGLKSVLDGLAARLPAE